MEKTLHPSSIPWNPLYLSEFQGLNGTNPPFITLHLPSFSLDKRSAFIPCIVRSGAVIMGEK